MESESKIFKYTYSASQQEEIKKIRKKYTPPTQEEDKMERLRRLDESATKSGRIVSLIVGIVSCLVMGLGMCCTMVWNGLMIQGIIIGLVGIAGVISAYPLYVKITKKRREKLAPEIIRLTDELMK
ncbi:MAG: hypothetical protein K2K89_00395 [Ruminococcus sp.]|nr:hypothetical protein [Ruminococcus sp.]